MVLTEESLLEALTEVREGLIALNATPTLLLTSKKHMKSALRILGLIKQPVRKVSGLRKRKNALYWRKKV
jgi:hypothetical protein